ncbi:acyl-CoA-binding protein homolog [Athalia rosae]|uniref:acyl-CoA-binding protein homolog n=1 Tax=Athalia rosae TaxID=37344 RepID=UPI00203329CB|nr:acyl-CoA-binding protein homolog [Athalia rosae]
MSLDQKFEAAAQAVKGLTKRPTDEELLTLYALYKQAIEGDNNTPKPGLLDLKGRAKWNSWDAKRGTSKDAAKEEYITFAEGLMAKYK